MLNAPYPVVLAILDGWGVASPSRGNAITLAYTPNYNELIQRYPATTLQASGEIVGLPLGDMGNSEVGHLNLGGGRIIYQNLQLINHAISDASFFNNQALKGALQNVKNNQSSLHLMGLVSEGGIHSSLNHLYALLELCRQEGVKDVYIHAFLDGRDTPHNSALTYVNQLQSRLQAMGIGKIATLMGRFYAMDRDNHWERIAQAYYAMALGQAQFKAADPLAAIEASYRRQVFDEEFQPTVITNADGSPLATIKEKDSVIFFNFRSDRARQLTKAFVLPGWEKFPNRLYLHNLFFVTMMEYEKNLPVHIAFMPDKIQTPVAKIISDAGLRQLHIAETEKYAHVTFFFNGGQEEPFKGEDRIIVPSPQVASYAEKPEMSALAVKDKVVAAINGGQYHFIVVNFANADMVGHTGNLEATKKAVQYIDQCLGEIAQAINNTAGTLLITADHGNAEEVFNLHTGEIDKEHSVCPVPFIIVGRGWPEKKILWPQIPLNDLSQILPSGALFDVAPTILHLLNLPKSPDMSKSSSLIK